MTLNGVAAVIFVISAKSLAFGAHCVNVVEVLKIFPNFLRQKYSSKFLVFSGRSISSCDDMMYIGNTSIGGRGVKNARGVAKYSDF